VFGIGGSEIIVILIVALLFLGPDKLPDAAKQISKHIRDLKRGSREIQQTIENDETIGGALRDIKSALRGEDPPPVRLKPKLVKKPVVELELPATIAEPSAPLVPDAQMQLDLPVAKSEVAATAAQADAPPAPAIRLPPDAGEVDPDLREREGEREELAAMIRPVTGTVAKGAAAATAVAPDDSIEPKHG